MIREDHPLRLFFREMVQRHYEREAGINDREVCRYVANMLTEFCEVETLYRVRDAAGRQLTDVGVMLLESDPVFGPAPSFDREREVRKHIGDYTLFFSGMFPESINRNRLRRQRIESFVDFIKAGKESYSIVAYFDQLSDESKAAVFSRLSDSFEQCVFGLNQVKGELDELQHPIMRRQREILM